MNRRHLLKTSALFGGAAAFAPFSQVLGANSQLRVAVIGIAGRGKSHIDGVISSPHARLVALCDVDTEILDKVAGDLKKKHDLPNLRTFTDYRKVVEDKEIDAVMIATPNHTHTLIAVTAAANGKHALVEKPVSHNVHEGRVLAQAQEKFGVIIAHGFQHRTGSVWEKTFDWLADAPLGKLTLARGFCYKPRPSIGKVDAPQQAPSTVDYDLWCGPREVAPVHRKRFHYDWHWQSQFGNGDLGNQGPHQLDICRWAIGDPATLPESTLSIGGRFAHDDDGDVPNSQIVFYDTKPVPIIFEVRGLPKEKLDYQSGMDKYQGVDLGNILEYEGGYVMGDHGSNCRAFDNEGKEIKHFKGGGNVFHSFIDAALGRIQQNKRQAAESGHLSSALAHIGNHSLALGKSEDQEKIAEKIKDNTIFADAYQRLQEHLAANGLGDIQVGLGVPLGLDADENFTGEFAEAATKLDAGHYRDPFKLPSLS